MATAGYLISRAAEQPPILSLTVAIVAVRFFGLARPLARYLERLVSHDLALPRARARPRRLLRADRAAGAGRARGLPAGRPALAHGRRRGRAPEPPPARLRPACSSQSSRAPSASASPRRSCPPRRSCSPAASSLGGCRRAPPRRPARPGGRPAAGRRRRRADGRARRAAASGAGARRLRPEERDGSRACAKRTDELVRIGRRDALVAGIGDGLQLSSPGYRGRRPLRSSVEAHAGGRLDRVLIAMLALLALAAFDAVAGLPPARARAVGDARRRAARARADRPRAAVADPDRPAPQPEAAGRARGRPRALRPRRAAGTARSVPAARARLPRRARRAERGRQDDRDEPPAAVPRPGGGPGDDRRSRHPRATGRRTSAARFAVAGQDAHLFDSSVRDNLLLGPPEASDEELDRGAPPVAPLGLGSSASGRARYASSVSTGGRCPAASASASVVARALLVRAPRCSCSTSRQRTSTRRPRVRSSRTSSTRPATPRPADHPPARRARARRRGGRAHVS